MVTIGAAMKCRTRKKRTNKMKKKSKNSIWMILIPGIFLKPLMSLDSMRRESDSYSRKCIIIKHKKMKMKMTMTMKIRIMVTKTWMKTI
jgi:hypothetical protein